MKTLRSRKVRSSLGGALLLGALATSPLHAQTYQSIIEGDSPLDFWRFTETVASPLPNTVTNLGSVGAAGTGYVVGPGYSVTGTNGIVGNGIFLSNPGQGSGTVDTKIDIPNIPALNPNPPFSIEFWAQPNPNATFAPSDSTGLCPLSSLCPDGDPNFSESARSGWLFYVTPTSWTMRLGGLQSYTAVCTFGTNVPNTSWTHVVGEFDGSTAYLYLNGYLVKTTPATSNPFQPNHFQVLRFGGTTLANNPNAEDANGSSLVSGGNRGWDGFLDEVAIYTNLLSSNTVMSHYTAGIAHSASYSSLILASSPVGYWPLNEGVYTPPSVDGTFAADIGSAANSGTNTIGTLADQPGVPGLGDPSVYYSGAIGSLVLDSPTPVNVAGQTLTLAAWIKQTGFDYVSDIIAQGFDTTNYFENFLRVGDSFDWANSQDNNSGENYNTNVVNNVNYYEVGAYDDGPGYVSAVFPVPNGDLGHWVFLVGTYDGENWNLYRNGVLAAQFNGSFPDGSGSGPVAVNYPWSVGSRSEPSPYFGMFFPGYIAEPAVLTTALSAATISNLYNKAALPPVVTAPAQVVSPAYVGQNVAYSIWADGPGGLHYQWYSNNVAMSGQTSSNLSLSGVTPSSDATYSVVVSNPYGSVTDSVPLFVTPSLPAVTIVPAAEKRWIGTELSFAPASLPSVSLTYQWYLNGTNIPGATSSNYTAVTTSSSAGSYTLIATSTYGAVTSSVSTLTPLTPPNSYVSTIVGDQPEAYFRLDEQSGTVAHDYAGGNDGQYIGALTLGVPGYSLVDTDTAVYFPGQAVDYVGNFGATSIDFPGTSSEFSIEAWAKGPAVQNVGTGVIVAKGHSNNGTTANEQFSLLNNGGTWEFLVRDSHATAHTATASTGPDGSWHHLVGVFDSAGGSMYLYVDGVQAASGSATGLNGGVIDNGSSVSIGSESSGPTPDYAYAFEGTIDEVAIYGHALSPAQVSAHYAAVYGPNTPPFITSQPTSVTNYFSLPATLSVAAAGTTPLTYQWNQNGSPVSGATTATLSFPSLDYNQAGTYTVGITNTISGGVVTGILSAPVTVTVLAPPTNPPAIPGMVMHLPFDNNLIDTTGRGNNATNLASGGAPLITNNYVQGVIGNAFQFQTTVDSSVGGTTNANYATLGVRPDLQFGSGSFTVSMWIQLPYNSEPYDLPFFTDVVGSTFGAPGYVFTSSFQLGGWGYSVYNETGSAGLGVYGPSQLLNDGNWHNLVFIIDQVNGATVYMDGVVSQGTIEGGSTAIGMGDIDSTEPATIGQDPTGLYEGGLVQSANTLQIGIDDLAVWKRALTPLEAASIYEAGFYNGVGITNAPLTFTMTKIAGPKLVLNWNEGVLQTTTNLAGAWTTLSVTSPYTNTPSGSDAFFRVKF